VFYDVFSLDGTLRPVMSSLVRECRLYDITKVRVSNGLVNLFHLIYCFIAKVKSQEASTNTDDGRYSIGQTQKKEVNGDAHHESNG